MSEAPNKIRPDTVEIALGDWKIKLVPSLKAALALSRSYEGLTKLIGRIGGFELDAFVAVIAEGGALTEKGRKDLAEKVFDAGLIELMPPLTRFVTLLASGGRSMKPTDGENEPDGESQDPPQN